MLPALFVVLAVGVGACGRDRTPVTVIKLGHGLDVNHPVHQAMIHMAREAARNSGGRLRIDLYPAEQLGSERECLELLQIGGLGMTKVSASVLESFAPSFRVLSLPYLFQDERHARAVLDGPLGQGLLLSAEPSRLRGLAYYDAGSRSFYTRQRPIHGPEDLAGQKIRTQESASAMNLVAALGASPTPIAWGELYTALQQGVVDGAENNPPSFYLSKHYEVSRYYTLDEHTSVPDVLLISTSVWNRLTVREQGWLKAAARESAVVQRELWRQATQEALAAVEAAGVTVLRVAKEPFAKQVEDLYADFRRSDPRNGRLLDDIRAMRPAAATGEGPRG